MALGIILHENAKTIKPEDHPMWPQGAHFGAQWEMIIPEHIDSLYS